MAHHNHEEYNALRAHGWITWVELEARVGTERGVRRRWARFLGEVGVWPLNVPRPVNFPRSGRGGDVLYPPQAAQFLSEAATLHPYAHFRGQHHSIRGKTRPLAPLRLLLASRGWQYDENVIRQDVVVVVEQFRALTGSTCSADCLGAWLFTGKVGRDRGKRSAYWSSKVDALLAWLSLLSGVPIRTDTWNGHHRLPSWPEIVQSVERSHQATIKAWIAALRPLLDGWCFYTPEPQTEEEILKHLYAPAPPLAQIRRDNITTRIFRLLNRGLEAAYWTRPGEDDNAKDPTKWGDVKRWDEIRKKQGYRLPEPSSYGRFIWRRGRLYEVKTGKVLFEVPKDRSLYYPDNQREVVTRLFRYAGVFVALGIATSESNAKSEPIAPPPMGDPLPWTCRFCKTHLRAAVVGDQPKVWCPYCFTESHELAGLMYQKILRLGEHELVN